MGGGNWSILLCKTQHNKYFLEIYFENRMNRWYYQKWEEIYYFLGNFSTCYLADMKKNRIFLEHHSMTLLELLLFIGQTCKTFLHKTDEQRIHPPKKWIAILRVCCLCVCLYVCVCVHNIHEHSCVIILPRAFSRKIQLYDELNCIKSPLSVVPRIKCYLFNKHKRLC